MASDQLENFIKVEVSIGYAAGATAIVLTGGEGAELPDPASGEYNLVWWDSTNFPDPADDPNVEVIRVTALATDTLTVTRAQEGSADTSKNTGAATYLMHLAATEKSISDVDDDERINQASHGLTATQPVYHNGTIYVIADALSAAAAESIGFVDDVSSDGDFFTLRTGGRMTGFTGLTVGESHFLSETPGAITATAPTTEGSIVKPVLIADSTTSGFIYNMRGTEVSSTASFFQAFTNSSLNSGVLTVNHNLGHTYATIQVYDNNDQMAMPDDITLSDANTALVDLTSFGMISSTPGSWHVVVIDTGTITSFTNTAFTAPIGTGAGLSVVINHGLNTLYPIVQVYDENGDVIQPDDITSTDADNTTIDLTSFGTRAGSYQAVIMAGGSITLSSASDLALTGQAAEDYVIYDGANWVAQGGSEIRAQDAFSRSMTDVSGTQSITTVGFRPSYVTFIASVANTDNASWGTDNGTEFNVIFTPEREAVSTPGTFQNSSDASATHGSIVIVENNNVDHYRGKITSFQSNGFTITWTKTGSPTGNITIGYTAFR